MQTRKIRFSDFRGRTFLVLAAERRLASALFFLSPNDRVDPTGFSSDLCVGLVK